MSLDYDLQNPPFVTDRNRQWQLYPGNTNAQNAEDATKNLQYLVQGVTVYYDSVSGSWKYNLHTTEDGTAGTPERPEYIITGAYYDAPFPVRSFALFIDDSTNYMQIIYDTPFSRKITMSWACGVSHPGHQITRLWTGDNAMAQGRIILSR